MTKRQRSRRRIALLFWRLFNPVARSLAGIAPWWVVLETTGRRSGERRCVPLARGPQDGQVTWLISVHGDRAAFARNIAADPRIRLRLRGRWQQGTAELVPMSEAVLQRFGLYARMGPQVFGIESKLVRIELE